MSDIKQRLQQWGEYNCEHLPSHTEELLQEAADHIAALEARNARLEEQVREAYERCAAYIEGKGGVIPGANVFAGLVSGNNQPCMSGDMRDRMHPPVRRRFDYATRTLAQSIRTLATEQANG